MIKWHFDAVIGVNTMEYQIINIAYQLIKSGKQPTVAMVKAKLSVAVPMPILINTLQKVSAMSPQKISQLLESMQPAAAVAERQVKDNGELSSLKAQVTQLQNDVDSLKAQLTNLEQLIKREIT